MVYSAYITRIKNVRKHSNADRLLVGDCFNNQVVVGLDTKEGDLGIYFPTDGKLSMEFLEANNLIGVKDPVTGNRTGGYFDEKGKVRTQKFRGEASDGYFCSVSYLAYTGADISLLSDGTAFTQINGKEICQKYVSQQTIRSRSSHAKDIKFPKSKFPHFHEHIDTEQLSYNMYKLRVGDVLSFTEKLHGTSQRSALSLEVRMPRWKQLINNVVHRQVLKPVEEYKYICGTRRVVIRDFDKANGWYGEDEKFRKMAHDNFVDKLHKGESVYYEIVGYVSPEKTVMNKCSNALVKDKEFSKKWGTETIFHYGCTPGQFDIYVYRISMINDEGIEIDYSYDTMKIRCSELGVKCVPDLGKIIYNGNGDLLIQYCEDLFSYPKDAKRQYRASKPSTLTPAHIMEGVVVRVDGSRWFALKHKSFEFKILEGIIKENEAAPDMEEAQDVKEESA
jgi:hypothetical protein